MPSKPTLSFRTILYVALTVVTAAALFFPGDAEAKSKKNQHKKSHRPSISRILPTPDNATILVDSDTGMVISQNDADRPLYPASLTKLMTLLLTFEALDEGTITLRSPVQMTAHAASMPPSKLGIRPGQSVTVDQAIRALVTKSANDIAVAMGEKLGGSERSFARMMNLKARELGMANTHFVNASGLHDVGQTSSPRDMAKLAMTIIHRHPRYYPYFSLEAFTFAGRKLKNHNHLMESYQGMDGMKTGYVSQSGFNLVASAKRGDARLIGVVFGGKTADSRNDQMAYMLDEGFSKVHRMRAMYPQISGKTLARTPSSPPPSSPSRSRESSVASSSRTENPTTRVSPQASAQTSAQASALTVDMNRFAPAAPTTDNVPQPQPQPQTQRLSSTQTPVSASSPYTNSVASFTAPVHQTAPVSGWSIQIGAFQDRNSTETAITSALNGLPSPLNLGKPLVVPTMTADNSWVFRARIGGYTREQALQACRRLSNCLPISPSAAD